MSSAAPEYAFATPFLNPPASPIRSLMPYAMRPGTISLAGGYPAQELFDVDGLTIASTQVLARLGACLQYSNIDGQASLRNELARLSAARGLHCNADTELAVTGGSQQAMALLTRVMLQPGDHAVIESPAFPNSVQALRYTGATVHTVPSGPDGVDIDALDELAARVKPKVVCVGASFSNPCGATISRQRRLRLLELAVKHRFLIVEDDPDQLAEALQALAGPGAGPNGGQFFIDGFTGTRLPPRESIREIRINQNPYSSEHDRLGFGRIEIFTRPGTDRYRGGMFMNFNDESLNSRNPFAPNRAPFVENEDCVSAGFLLGQGSTPVAMWFFIIVQQSKAYLQQSPRSRFPWRQGEPPNLLKIPASWRRTEPICLNYEPDIISTGWHRLRQYGVHQRIELVQCSL